MKIKIIGDDNPNPERGGSVRAVKQQANQVISLPRYHLGREIASSDPSCSKRGDHFRMGRGGEGGKGVGRGGEGGVAHGIDERK